MLKSLELSVEVSTSFILCGWVGACGKIKMGIIWVVKEYGWDDNLNECKAVLSSEIVLSVFLMMWSDIGSQPTSVHACVVYGSDWGCIHFRGHLEG